jgi:hypothetical protein
MRSQDHDATNTRTLDSSGNGRHITIAGAAKLTKHGYYLDGGDYMTGAINGTFNTAEITFAIEFTANFVQTSAGNKVLYDSTAASRYVGAMISTGEWWMQMGGTTMGATVSAATIAPYWRIGASNIIVISSKSGKTNMYFNNGHVDVDKTTAWTPKDPSSLFIGSNYTLSENWTGNVTRFAVYPLALNKIQVFDLQAAWQMKASEV